jgi:LacI family transcriptional regulator
MPYDEAFVRFGDFDPDSGYQQMGELLSLNRIPSAVFVASDVVAIGAKAAIVEKGLRIPEDIALVGFDDIPLARYLDPPLTTVRLPASELATRASQMLVQLINNETPAEKLVLLESQLIVRQSCGAEKHID